MSNAPLNTDVDPQALASAKSLWHNFTSWMTYGVIGAAGLLLALCALFVY